MAKKKIEKIWLLGKTRDFDENYEQTLKDDVKDYFDGKIDEDIPIKVCDNGDSLSITFGLDCGEKCSEDTLPQSIAVVLSGMSKDFVPQFPIPTCPSFGGRFNVNIQKEDFAESYKKNVKHYGATPVKEVEVTTPDEGGFIMKLSY